MKQTVQNMRIDMLRHRRQARSPEGSRFGSARGRRDGSAGGYEYRPVDDTDAGDAAP